MNTSSTANLLAAAVADIPYSPVSPVAEQTTALINENATTTIANTASPSASFAATDSIPSLNMSSIDEFKCQWSGCTVVSTDAASLLSHIMDHVRTTKQVTHPAGQETDDKNPSAKKFVCGWESCTTALGKKDHLMSHVRIHVACKPFVCQVCAKPFKRKQDVRKHERTTHRFKPEAVLAGLATAAKFQPYTIPSQNRRYSFDNGSFSMLPTPDHSNSNYLISPPSSYTYNNNGFGQISPIGTPVLMSQYKTTPPSYVLPSSNMQPSPPISHSLSPVKYSTSTFTEQPIQFSNSFGAMMQNSSFNTYQY